MISIIVPFYNSSDYLRRCLISIFNSTYKDYELILVDDGSTTDSFEITNIQTYARIIIIKQKNQGVSVARNIALKLSKGEYIAFIDSDDWISPFYFERLLAAMSDECDISICGMTRTRVNEIENNPAHYKPKIMDSLYALNDYNLKNYVWGRLYRKNVLDGLEFAEKVDIEEDKIFNLQIFQKCKKISITKDKLYYYFASESQVKNTRESYPAALKLLDLSKHTNNNLYLKNAYSAFLSHRYLKMFETNSKEIKKDVNQRLKECKKLSKKIMSFRERFIYNFFSDFPFFYRLFRILQDKTMLKWEKNKRAMLKNKKTICALPEKTDKKRLFHRISG